MRTLGPAARTAWGKSPRDPDSGEWLSLHRHLEDSLGMALRIWDEWLPASVRRQIAEALPGGEADGRRLVAWMAGIHDIGKATVAFACQVDWLAEQMRRAGLAMPTRANVTDREKAPHSLTGYFLLLGWLRKNSGWAPKVARSYAVIVGSHHGICPDLGATQTIKDRPHLVGMDHWTDVQTELMDYVGELAGVTDRLPEWGRYPLPVTIQVLVTAAVILADWLASDPERFPYNDPGRSLRERSADAWADLSMPRPWTPRLPTEDVAELFAARFDLPEDARPRPVQERAVLAAREMSGPGILVIEAAMGAGKTEAAFCAAEVLAARFGLGGVFLALPTQATSNALFDRAHDWVERLPFENGPGVDRRQTLFLAHGKARLHDEFRGLVREWQVASLDVDEDCSHSGPPGSWVAESAVAVAHSWLTGRKKGPMANFVVGTIDQVLFMALQSRHVMLRHLALANKVVIVDEVHAADVYMQVYLERALHWLAAYRVPVVLLSATLPSAQRRALVCAYTEGATAGRAAGRAGTMPVSEYQKLDGDLGYPVVTVASGGQITVEPVKDTSRSGTVWIERLADDDALLAEIEPVVAHGGCIAIVRNTVARAQETADLLTGRFGEDMVELLHSRFLSVDRVEKEKELVDTLGSPETVRGAERERPVRRIVVATQVIEQSLDVDFDLLITDLAPIDLLLQRIGRLHRHRRDRPVWLRRARCLITGVRDWAVGPPEPVPGSRVVYGLAGLLRAASTLAPYWETGTINLPEDIPVLVQTGYDPAHRPSAGWEDAMAAADQNAHDRSQARRRNAAAFQIRRIQDRSDLEGWTSLQTGEDMDEGPRGTAQVRDGEDTIEVLVVRRAVDGLRVLEWVPDGGGRLIETEGADPPDAETARIVAGCTLRLPPSLSRGEAATDEVITALEKNYYPSWQKSPWLARQLVLELDEGLRARIGAHPVRYDRRQGLLVLSEEETK